MFFDSNKPRISRYEFRELQQALASRGFSQTERNKIESIFLADLEEESDYQKGIDAAEIGRTLKWLRANKSKHGLSDHKLDILEAELKERL